MPPTPFVDWRDSTPKLWARFTTPRFPDGVYHAFGCIPPLRPPLPGVLAAPQPADPLGAQVTSWGGRYVSRHIAG